MFRVIIMFIYFVIMLSCIQNAKAFSINQIDLNMSRCFTRQY